MNRKKALPIIFISLSAFTNVVIIANACFTDRISGGLSNGLSNFFIKIINHNRTEEATYTPVESIEPVLSSEYSMNYLLGYQPNEIAVGATKQLITRFNPSNATNRNVVYSTDSEDVILKQSGDRAFITPLTANDNLKIKVESKDGNFVEYYTFKAIEPVAPADFSISFDNGNQLGVGLTKILKISVNNVDEFKQELFYDYTKLNYSSEDTSIATIDNHGVVTAKSIGSTKINVSNGTINKSININIVSNDIINIPDTLTLSKENEYCYIEDATYDNNDSSHRNKLVLDWGVNIPTDKNVIFTSSDPLIATVNQDGFVRGFRKEGTAIITAQSTSNPLLLASTEINVIPVKASSIEAEDKDIVVEKGCTLFLNPKVLPENTTNKKLVAETNSNLIEIYSNGQTLNIFGKETGNCTMKVYVESNPSAYVIYRINIIPRGVINGDNANAFYSFIRKSIGHFLLFAVDGVFTTLAFYFLLLNKKHDKEFTVLSSIGVGIFVAILSEFIQLFVPGRSAAVKDVLIDLSGFILSMFIIGVVWIIKYFKSKKKIQK